MVAGEYWVLKKLFGWSLEKEPFTVVRIILITINVLPLILYLALLAQLAEHLRPERLEPALRRHRRGLRHAGDAVRDHVQQPFHRRGQHHGDAGGHAAHLAQPRHVGVVFRSRRASRRLHRRH